MRNLFIILLYMASNKIKLFKIIPIIFGFLLGFIYCLTYKSEDLIETFSLGDDCPDLLIRKGTHLQLINTKRRRVPGVNPVSFKNLDEYLEYVRYMRSAGKNCPILYFQETYDAQNNKGYRLLPDPMEPNAGLPSNMPNYQKEIDKLPKLIPSMLLMDSNRDDPPFNQNQFAGFDEQDQYVGAITPLDKIQSIDDPMSKNWGGHDVTIQAIKSGKYKNRTRNPAKF